jgi:tetratricopeptide (TPR) repeat protein
MRDILHLLAASFFLILPLATVLANGDGPEICPVEEDPAIAESKCLEAVNSAERGNDSELLSELLEGLAIVYERQGRYEDAIQVLRRSIESTRHPLNASMRLVRLLEKTGQLEQAAEVLHSLSAWYDSATGDQAWMKGGVELQLGDVYLELGNETAAEEHYRRAIQNLSSGPGDDPTLPAVSRLARLYVKQGRTSEANDACRRWKESSGVAPTAAREVCEQLVEDFRARLRTGQ